jgi:signal transduction histidine kinase
VAISTAMLPAALGFALLNEQTVLLGRYHHPLWLRSLDVVLGVACLAGVYWWRRWPVAFAVFAIVAGTVSTLGAGTPLVGVFAVAVHRPWRTAVAVSVLAIVSVFASLLLYPLPHFWFNASVGILLTAALTGWGMFVRARRQLLTSLRADVARERERAMERVVAARRTERERIAREMHDVLAHRLSLLAVHAGSLQFRPDASPAEIALAADVIRDSAHAALEDLRSVIAVLRDPDAEDHARPQPTAAGIPELIEESRSCGLAVRFTAPAALERLDPTIGRTLYRIVQEGLTNVRKHAPSAHVEVTIGGTPGACMDVTVHNTTTAGATSGVPGSGTGLIGLRERAVLAGGSLEHGPVDGGTGYRLEAHLPWPAPSPHRDEGAEAIREHAQPQATRQP